MIYMQKPNVDSISKEDLEKILLIGRIKTYSEHSEHDLFVDYYFSTGEITLDSEFARKVLSEMNNNLTSKPK